MIAWSKLPNDAGILPPFSPSTATTSTRPFVQLTPYQGAATEHGPAVLHQPVSLDLEAAGTVA